MKECFTCSNKLSRDLSKEERKQLSDEYFKEHGRRTLLIPEMEFTCALTGKKIKQIDPACENYSGDKLMESVRKSLSDTAKKLRQELKSRS